MNFLKKNYKLIIGIVIGAILISGMSVYATSTYLASQVNYKDNKTVEDALDELYTKAQNGTFKKCDIELDDNGYGLINNIGFTPKTIMMTLEISYGYEYVYVTSDGDKFAFLTNGESFTTWDEECVVFGENDITLDLAVGWKNAKVSAVIFEDKF